MNVNFKSSIAQGKSLRFGKSNDGKKTLLLNKNYVPPQPTLEDNLLIYWNFENENITPAFQANTYTVQQVGTPTYVNDGPSGSKAVRLALNSRIILRDNLWNHYTGPYTSFTISTWVRKMATNSNGQDGVILANVFGPMSVILQQYAQPFNPPSELGLNANNNLTASIINSNNGIVAAIWQTNFSWNLQEWIHAVIVNDFPNKTIKLFVNGSLKATNTYNALGANYSDWNGICFNGSPTSTNGSEYGKNYDFALTSIWNRNLSDNEISLLYNQPLILN
jgi:hypothetical protein